MCPLKISRWGQKKKCSALLTLPLLSAAQHVSQPLPQPVIDADRFLQALAQGVDLNKILFQLAGPCCKSPRRGEACSVTGSYRANLQCLCRIYVQSWPSANFFFSSGQPGSTRKLCSKCSQAFSRRRAPCRETPQGFLPDQGHVYLREKDSGVEGTAEITARGLQGD